PNSIVSLAGLLATLRRLTAEERTALTTGASTLRRPHRVNIIAPASARSTAMTTSALLLDGTLNARPIALPDQTKKMTRSAAWTRPPATLFRPTPATAVAGSTPDFARNRMLSTMPPMLAGVTRLTNDDATCASVAGTNATRWGTEPMIPIAAPT